MRMSLGDISPAENEKSVVDDDYSHPYQQVSSEVLKEAFVHVNKEQIVIPKIQVDQTPHSNMFTDMTSQCLIESVNQDLTNFEPAEQTSEPSPLHRLQAINTYSPGPQDSAQSLSKRNLTIQYTLPNNGTQVNVSKPVFTILKSLEKLKDLTDLSFYRQVTEAQLMDKQVYS